MSPNNYEGPAFFPSLMFNSEFDDAKCNSIFISTQYYFNDVVKLLNDDCDWYDTSEYIAGGDEQVGRFAW